MKVPNQYRVRTHPELGSTDDYGNNGAFRLPPIDGRELFVIAGDGYGWEHVSVSVLGRQKATPTWEEMERVKRLFWDDEECVVQYHPARSRYVNKHPGCLHLWRPKSAKLPLPPDWMVG